MEPPSRLAMVVALGGAVLALSFVRGERALPPVNTVLAAGPRLALSPTAGRCGEVVHFQLRGFRGSEQVRVSIRVPTAAGHRDLRLATVKLEDGAGKGRFTIPYPRDGLVLPRSKSSVTRTITARGLGSGRTARFTRFRVERCPWSAPPTPTPTATPVPPLDPGQVGLRLEPMVTGVDQPVHVTHAGDGSGRLFVVEKAGRVQVVKGGILAPPPFLDITDRVGSSEFEQGLLSIAFHPRFRENGLFFVDYTDRAGDTVIARYRVSDDPDRADHSSGVTILRIDQPAPNHNGGQLAFGFDGYLYIGMGDGGGGGDTYGNGQNRRSLLGKLLRIDVDRGGRYAIPRDNPFVDRSDTRPEIWALGLRNPWRFSFDRLTGDLYIADVGQESWEEINLQRRRDGGGQNYGWPIMEGRHCYPNGGRCDRAGLVLPILDYSHAEGCSITGGFVYRGRSSTILQGHYLFSDFCSGVIWALERSGGSWRKVELLRSGALISSFGEDEAGELYVASYNQGTVSRLVTAR